MAESGMLATTSLHSPEAGFTDCAFVNSADMVALAAKADVDGDAAKRRGMLCSVGEAVLYLKCVAPLPASTTGGDLTTSHAPPPPLPPRQSR